MEDGTLRDSTDRPTEPVTAGFVTDDCAQLIPSTNKTVTSQSGAGALDKMRGRLAEMSYTDPARTSGANPGGSYGDTAASDPESNRSKSGPPVSGQWSAKARYLTPMTGILLLCLVLLLGFVLLSVVLKVRLDGMRSVCGSPECMILSGEILSRMSLDESPCLDFYEYSCAAFTQPEVRPPDKSEWNMFSVATHRTLSRVKYLLSTNGSEYRGNRSRAVAKAKLFHSACLNTSRADSDGSTNLLQLIQTLGSWPLTSGDTSGTWNPDTWTLQEALYRTLSKGFYPFLSVWVETDLRNSSLTMIGVGQSGLLLYSDLLYSSEDVEKFRTAYINYFIDVMTLLGERNSRREAEEMWDLERAVAGAFVRRVDMVDVESTYNVMSIADLQRLISDGHASFPLDMLDLIQRLIHPSVTDSTKIIVTVPNYFHKVGFIIKAARASTLASYVVWCAVRGMARHAGSGFESAVLRFTGTLSGVTEPSPRWERCVELTMSALGFSTGALYVENYLSAEDKRSVEEIVRTLVQEFSERLRDIRWMDDVTRERAREKAMAIESKVGYPEFIKDSVKLDEYYEELDITDDIFDNILSVKRFTRGRNIRRYGRAPDREEWHDYPTEVNAYYSHSTNQIIIPAGILQKPFYDSSYPKSLVFGSIGFIVGHEITHGFDNNGRKFDKQGNLADWWSESSATGFTKRSQCFREEYDQFMMNGLQLNGRVTLGENIADNGGTKLSLAAYRRWVNTPLKHTHMRGGSESIGRGDHVLPGLNMTREQQFFVGTAQIWCSIATEEKLREDILTNSHSIKRFRVNGVVSNVPDFSEAFKCSTKDELRPREICSLW